ncbi:hypothetical protein C8Q76DRAFT_737152 [Earliella scabrosa]|nr:hypothetical protein C8Q76DRAFT_737152 [Earliella scabrosa]
MLPPRQESPLALPQSQPPRRARFWALITALGATGNASCLAISHRRSSWQRMSCFPSSARRLAWRD